jgi:hypothetical protein
VPSMRIPPLPRRAPFQMIPEPRTEVTRSAGVTGWVADGSGFQNMLLT